MFQWYWQIKQTANYCFSQIFIYHNVFIYFSTFQFYSVVVLVVIVLQTVLTASLPKQFQNILMQLMPKNRAIHYREARYSEDEAESLSLANLETKVG